MQKEETKIESVCLKERQRARERKKQEIEIDKIEIDTHLFEKWNQKIKLGRFRQNITKTGILQENITRLLSILLQEKLTISSHKSEQLIEILRF